MLYIALEEKIVVNSTSIWLYFMYEKLTRVMKTAGEMTFPASAKINFTPVPGWRELLETPYNETRNAYLVWRSAKGPRSGPGWKGPERDSNKLKKLIKSMKTPFVPMRWLQNLILEI